ncbi:MAG: hypothetical protein KC501_16955 [Myxococcales bacterium]|nr:hypothetical protein [Myxococcales bacterium]
MSTDERLHDYLRQSLDVAARCGYGREDDVIERFEEQVRDELHDQEPEAREAALATWMAELGRALTEQRAREQGWTEPTHNDRIDTAFAELRRRGIVALQDAGYTMSDGWEDVHEARRRVKGAWGATFFHRQDVERGVDGRGLMLAYGAFADGDEHEPQSLRLAREVCEVLEAHGVPTRWSGSLSARIEVLPFEWRKRRWTRAPQG